MTELDKLTTGEFDPEIAPDALERALTAAGAGDPLARLVRTASRRAESLEAHEAFITYAMLGYARPPFSTFYRDTYVPDRTRRGLPVREFSSLSAWRTMYAWTDRLAEYDRQELAMRQIKFRWEADQNQLQRVMVLKALLSKAVTAMNALNPADATWADVTRAVSAVVTELRKEYGQDITRAMVVVGSAQESGQADPYAAFSDEELQAVLQNVRLAESATREVIDVEFDDGA